MDWQVVLLGKNKNLRAQAAEAVVNNPPDKEEVSASLDKEKALNKFTSKSERGITKEAIFVLLCLCGDADNVGTLSKYFIGKEYAPYGQPAVKQTSYEIFRDFLNEINQEPLDIFDASQHLSNDRIMDIFVELSKDARPFVEILEKEFLDDSFHSQVSISNVKLLCRTIGEEKTFDKLFQLTTENLTKLTQASDKWFHVNQNGGRKIWDSTYVNDRLIQICKDETSLVVRNGKPNTYKKMYLLYGSVVGIASSFPTRNNLEVVFNSLLDLINFPRLLTFHTAALGNNLEVSCEFMLLELEKETDRGLWKTKLDQFCEVLSRGNSWNKSYDSEQIMELIWKISRDVSDDKFEYFVRNSESFFGVEQIADLVRLVAYARFGYDDPMKDAEIDQFIAMFLYGCGYLLEAVKSAAHKGSEAAKEWLGSDTLKIKIGKMFEDGDQHSLAEILKGLNSGDDFEEIFQHVVVCASNSTENKKLLLEVLSDDQSFSALSQFLIRELNALVEDRGEGLTNLTLSAVVGHIDAYTSHHESEEMAQIIIKIITSVISNSEEGEVLKQILHQIGSVRYGAPKKILGNFLLEQQHNIPKQFEYKLSVCLNKMGYWNNYMEDVFLKAVDEDYDSPELLYGHIFELRKGDDVSDLALNRILEIFNNHKNSVVRMFAAECLGWREHPPSVPFLIEALRDGPQSENEMKLELTNEEGRVEVTFIPKPPSLGPYQLKDVYTSAINSLCRLHEHSADELRSALFDDNDHVSAGAFHALKTGPFRDLNLSKEESDRMNFIENALND